MPATQEIPTVKIELIDKLLKRRISYCFQVPTEVPVMNAGIKRTLGSHYEWMPAARAYYYTGELSLA